MRLPGSMRTGRTPPLRSSPYPQISWGVDLHESEVRSVPGGNQVAGDSSGVLPGFWVQHRARRIVVDSEWIKAAFGICHRYQNVRANRRLVWTGLRAARQG